MKDNHSLFLYDQDISNNQSICGIDEVGRGPLAGPVYACCVMLPRNYYHPMLNDSKQLSEKKRESLFQDIVEFPGVKYGIGIASEIEIDNLNILNATFLAMNRAYQQLIMKLTDSEIPLLALVDGNRDPHLPIRTKMVVKGDAISAHIAAASVIAKVSRDHYMSELGKQFPEYCLDKNKGYGSREHYHAILKYGILPIHRKSFLKNLNDHKE